MASESTSRDNVTNIKSSSLLHFPRPHQLGTSSGLHQSRATRANVAVQPQPMLTPDNLTPTSKKPQLTGQDEVDFYQNPLRKALLKQKGLAKPVVKTFDERPLSELVLYLPPRLPLSIVHSKQALCEFVGASTVSYVTMWELAKELKILNLQFPSQYAEKLANDFEFLNVFLQNVFDRLRKIKSIEQLLLPKIVLNSLTDLSLMLQPIADCVFAVSHLTLHISSEMLENDLKQADIKTVASLLRKSSIKSVTLVSDSNTVSVFTDKLSRELKRYKKNSPNVSYSEPHLEETPGPQYIADMNQPTVCGEIVDPCSLVDSLNTSPAEDGTVNVPPGKAVKKRARTAFSTDCTYADEAVLTTDGPFVSEIWNLDNLHERGIDGKGTTIAVLDSGINYTHPAFKGKIVAIKNFVEEDIDNIDCAIDSDGHGTHCAGIAVGGSHFHPVDANDPNSRYIRVPPGVAPGAKLVVCKVVNTSNGDVDSNAFLASLKWLKEQHVSGVLKIDVISISLASTYHSRERAMVISDLTSLGVIVVCCASNVGRLRLQPISFPGRLGHVLCIGAHDQNGKPTSFSPVGRELDFLSPGEDLWGPGPGTIGPFAMDCCSGTSCATPAVAGLICLVLQAVSDICQSDCEQYTIGDKSLIEHVRNVWVMREILKEMSSSPGHHSEEVGYGTLNPYRVLDRSHEEIMRIVNEIIEDE